MRLRLPLGLNGRPGFVLIHADGTVQTLTVEIHEVGSAIYVVRNPEKLGHIVQSMLSH
jgi:hypothetical protein